jgi:hypothetical protein
MLTKHPNIICAQWTFALVFAAICLATTAKAEDVPKLNALCKEEGARLVAAEAQANAIKTYTADGVKAYFSFSTTIDACVGMGINYLQNDWFIVDVFGTFVDAKALFNCHKEGVNNTRLDAVRRFNGHVNNKSYSEWLDDGEGGLTTKELAPPSQDKCEELFKKKLAELCLVDEPKW